ncbi:MAG: hypothetical protein IJW17_09935 [Lentisphaeria bacterium]|nr:hypothetical protein [Lentisphaeria bacterium]
MKKSVIFMLAAFTAVVFCGCASFTKVETDKMNDQKLAYSGKTIAHVEADNWGIYLFHIPLLTGSVDNLGDIQVLKDTVTVEGVAKVMTREAKALGGTQVINTVTTMTTNPFFFGIKEVKMSANVIK